MKTTFYTENGKIWAVVVDDENGEVMCVCSVTVDVASIETDEERDRWWYVARLGNPLNREIRSLVKKGGNGLAQAVAGAGAWANPKLLAAHLDEILASQWNQLYEKLRARNDGEDDDPEAISVYEGFWEWLDNNLAQFGATFGFGDWGFIFQQDMLDQKNVRVAAVWISAFAKFFSDLGVKDKTEREAVLRFWKKKGWLGALKEEKFSNLPEGRFQTSAWDKHFKRTRRVYAVREK